MKLIPTIFVISILNIFIVLTIFSRTGVVVGTVQCSIECNDQFYCENNFCKPVYNKFEEYPHSYIVATDVLIILVISIGLVTMLATLISDFLSSPQAKCMCLIYTCAVL